MEPHEEFLQTRTAATPVTPGMPSDFGSQSGSDTPAVSEKKYDYRTLPKNSIRIFLLHPGAHNHPLRGELEIRDLDNSGTYVAMSYAWGEPVFKDALTLRGGHLRITASLASALRTFRKSNEPIALWIDQVCINQADIRERGSQVALMGQIYRRAQQVFVWLGAQNPSDLSNLWMLQFLVSNYTGFGEHEPQPQKQFNHLDRLYRQSQLVCACCGLHFTGPERFRAAFALLNNGFWNRAWFRRWWVVQEIALAQMAVFWYGDHHISGTVFKHGTEICKALSTAVTYGFSMPIWSSTFGDINQAIRTLNVGQNIQTSSSRPGQALMKAVLDNTGSGFSDPHDMIYAVRELCGLDQVVWPESEVHGLEPSADDARLVYIPSPVKLATGKFIEADYEIPVSELWKRLASFIITCPTSWVASAESGSFIDGIEHHPAAALKVTILNDGAFITFLRAFQKSILVYKHRDPSFAAGGPMRPDSIPEPGSIPHNLSSTPIVVKAVKVSSVGAIYKRWTEWERIYSNATESSLGKSMAHHVAERILPWYLDVRNFLTTHSSRSLDSKQIVRLVQEAGSFAWIATIFKLNSGTTLTFEEARSFDQFPKLSKFKGGISAIEEALGRDIHTGAIDRQSPAYRELRTILQLARSGARDGSKSLASLSNGLVACIPREAEIGDPICLVQGCPFPFAVRRSNFGGYTVSGETYVHGIMQGQAWSAEKAKYITLI